MSVAGRQDMVTVWEQAVQPTVFAMILLRYGGTEQLECAARAIDVIANGQCFMLSRTVYDAIGRHAAVREFVAEDLMIAQAVWKSGHRVSLVRGVDQLSTRMYDSLPALMRGWGKNVYAGGRFAMPEGSLMRWAYPVLLPLFPLSLLAPFVVLFVAIVQLIFGTASSVAIISFAFVSSVGVLATFAQANRMNRDPIHRALFAPLGAAILLAICVVAVARGQHVSWKSRDYVAA